MSTLNVLTIGNIISKILIYFLPNGTFSSHSDYCRFDIELLPKGNDFYVIRVRNCGHMDISSKNLESILREIVKYCFTQMLEAQRLNKYLKSIVCNVSEEKCDKEEIYKFKWQDETFHLSLDSEKWEWKRRDGRKQYLTLGLECRIPPQDCVDSRDFLIETLMDLAELNKNVGYIFRSGETVFWESKVKSDDENRDICQIFGKAFMTIVENSQNQCFRRKCLRSAGVSEASDIAHAVTKQLALLMREKDRDEAEKKERSVFKRKRSWN